MIGASVMGSGITEFFSRVGGYKVVMCDTDEELVVQRRLDNERKNLQEFFVDKDKITVNEMEEILGRIKLTTNIAESFREAAMVTSNLLP